MKYLLNLSAFIFLVSCVPQSKYDNLLGENKILKEQLDECQNGEQRLIGRIEKNYDEQNYSSAKSDIELLFEKHPHSGNIPEYKKLLVEIEEKEETIRIKKEIEEKERIRIENLSNTGMWEIKYFVDEFGDKTNEPYITNRLGIYGTFSNSATENSRLRVDFLISKIFDLEKNGFNITIQLYEYAGNNPVKDGGAYYLIVEDRDGLRQELEASNDSGDRMRFHSYSFRGEETDNKKMQKILLKGGIIRFVIKENTKYSAPSEYKFTIENADFYENAVRMLMELDKKE